MTLIQILLLAVVQGAAELLPVSSSAHVIFAERLMGLDPGSPEATFLLVMLHTGTMLAVLVYFRSRWAPLLFPKARGAGHGFLKAIVFATICTGVLGLALKKGIEKVVLESWLGHAHGEVEQLFRNLPLMAASLAAAGVLILYSARRDVKEAPGAHDGALDGRRSIRVGLVQGLCLPFRGFSRSGATISTALLMGVPRRLAEEFSFALAVVLTPPVLALELHRLMKARAFDLSTGGGGLGGLLAPGALGMVFSFGAGLLALRLLSSWLEEGRWKYFGYYCLGASCVVMAGHLLGV
jgi:undecaprenyl-diphosphatase